MNDIKIKKKTLFMVVAVLFILGFVLVTAVLFSDYFSDKFTQEKKFKYDGEYQEVTLNFINYEYVLEPSVIKKDVPVRLVVNLDTVYGCMRDIVISSFNVRKFVSQEDNIIEFLPDKSGEFVIACSMNMGRGKFTVVEDLNKIQNENLKNSNIEFSGSNPVFGCH